MPWKIEKRDGGARVVEKDGEEVMCYTGDGAEEKAERLMAALYASEPGAAGKAAEDETRTCECLDCDHTVETKEHCADVKCPECGGEMRRQERPGPGKSTGSKQENKNSCVCPKCGEVVPREPGTVCALVKCKKCKLPLIARIGGKKEEDAEEEKRWVTISGRRVFIARGGGRGGGSGPKPVTGYESLADRTDDDLAKSAGIYSNVAGNKDLPANIRSEYEGALENVQREIDWRKAHPEPKKGTTEEIIKRVEVLEDTIRVRVRNPDKFQEDSFRTIVLSEDEGIKAVVGRLTGEETTTVQTYIFDKDKWDSKRAQAWVKKNKKATSLDQQRQQVSAAWRAKFVRRGGVPMTDDSYWPKEVFDKYLIVEAPDGLYSYPYTIAEGGEVEFGDPVKVKVEYVPIAPSTRSVNFAVKSLGETEKAYIVGGYGIAWGDEKQRDLSPWPNADGSKGEFFTPATAGLDDIPVKVMTFEHDKDQDESGEPIKEALGHTILERDDLRGRWIEAQIEKGRRYAQYVMDLLNRGDLYLSSETASHWRDVADNGEIKRWRTAGYTFTTHPMEPRIGSVDALKSYYVGANLAFPPDDSDDGKVDAGASSQDAEKVKALTEIELELIELARR